MLHNAIHHYPLLCLQLSTSSLGSAVFCKTRKHEFPVQSIFFGLTDQAKPIEH